MPTEATLDTCTTRLHAGRARGREHVLDARHVDGLHVRALGLEMRHDAGEVEITVDTPSSAGVRLSRS